MRCRGYALLLIWTVLNGCSHSPVSEEPASDSLTTVETQIKRINARLAEGNLAEALAEESRLNSVRHADGAATFQASALLNPTYRIVEREDLSYADVSRYQFRVRVESPQTESQLQAICRTIIASQPGAQSANAVAFLFYLPGTDTRGFFTAGQGVFAADGKWENAGHSDKTARDTYRLVVEVGSCMARPQILPVEPARPEHHRQLIFYCLVKAQDDGVGDEDAYRIVARQYGLSVDDVREIAIQGVTSGWPMP